MENTITITVEGLLWFCGAIAAIGGATAVISRWLTPFKKLKEDVSQKANQADFEALKREVSEWRGYQKTDHKELEVLTTGNEKVCQCLLAIIDHELTGNSVDRLRKAKDEMQEYLIKR